eukprot:COSAG06_NODE_57688_length_279_cov_1.138889_1_plen_26_part_10
MGYRPEQVHVLRPRQHRHPTEVTRQP